MSLFDIPIELITRILNKLDIYDLITLSITCTKLRTEISTLSIWSDFLLTYQNNPKFNNKSYNRPRNPYTDSESTSVNSVNPSAETPGFFHKVLQILSNIDLNWQLDQRSSFYGRGSNFTMYLSKSKTNYTGRFFMDKHIDLKNSDEHYQYYGIYEKCFNIEERIKLGFINAILACEDYERTQPATPEEIATFYFPMWKKFDFKCVPSFLRIHVNKFNHSYYGRYEGRGENKEKEMPVIDSVWYILFYMLKDDLVAILRSEERASVVDDKLKTQYHVFYTHGGYRSY